jgi:hypothetical protein
MHEYYDRLELQSGNEYNPALRSESQELMCTLPAPLTVSRFPRYQQSIEALPPGERAKIRLVAHGIASSFRPGCQPVRNVRLVGHADRDVQRGPTFERKISGDRARQVQQAIIRLIGNPAVTSQIAWQTVAAGATQLAVPMPRTELQRAENRRVEILPGTGVSCSVPPTANPRFVAWMQQALNRSLGVRLPVTGRYDVPTKTALASFQSSNRLTPSTRVFPALVSALALVSKIPIPCDVVPPVQIECGGLDCPSAQLSGKLTVNLAKGPIVFEFCWSTLGFNPTFRGEVDSVGAKNDRLRFSCRRDTVTRCPDGAKLRRHPAWKYQGAVVATGRGLGSPSDWHFSFLQTVRSSRWLAVYSGGKALECVVNNARDALIGAGQPDSPPWFCAGAVQELCSGKTAVIEDSPAINFPVNHPQDATQELRVVCFKAKFEIWLGVKKKADPPSGIILLAHKHIELDRMWKLRPGGTVASPSSWLFFGGQKESRSAASGGPTAPVLAGSTANQQAVSCPTATTTNAQCAEPGDFPGSLLSDLLACPLPGSEPPLSPCVPD